MTPEQCRIETLNHIMEVRDGIGIIIAEFLIRQTGHDLSKLKPPESEAFERLTPKLKGLTYGSVEYNECLKELGPALQHHYRHNSHHPEHYPDGIKGMSLLDILEMLVDWKAATKRHADGCIRKSIEINQKRFGYTDELKQILLNTLVVLEK